MNKSSKYNDEIDKYIKYINSTPFDEVFKNFEKYDNFIYSSHDPMGYNYNTNTNCFTNNRNSNNVKITNSYSSSQSRNNIGTDIIQGIPLFIGR